MRDEAHRFAVAYHRKLRGKDMFLPGRETIAAEESDSVIGGGGQQDFESIAGMLATTAFLALNIGRVPCRPFCYRAGLSASGLHVGFSLASKFRLLFAVTPPILANGRLAARRTFVVMLFVHVALVGQKP